MGTVRKAAQYQGSTIPGQFNLADGIRETEPRRWEKVPGGGDRDMRG